MKLLRIVILINSVFILFVSCNKKPENKFEVQVLVYYYISNQETFKLISKILLTKDTTYWKPTMKPNNHWSNWESGNL